MNRFYKISSYSVSILGTIHIAFTPVFYKNLNPDTLWFIGTGLAFIFLGFLNLATIRKTEKITIPLCLPANILGTVFSILLLIQLAELQAVIGVILLISMTAGSINLFIKN